MPTSSGRMSAGAVIRVGTIRRPHSTRTPVPVRPAKRLTPVLPPGSSGVTLLAPKISLAARAEARLHGARGGFGAR